MAEILIKSVNKNFGGVKALSNFNLQVNDKEFISLVGPSGCGKSTTLNLIAGLEDITEGEIFIDGKLINQTLPGDRDIAMVFQTYALYPHKTVEQNIGFSLKVRGYKPDIISKKVLDVMNKLDLISLLKRKPKELSGGQRQRVALGRALVREPKLFLLDEPLSNLDSQLRVAMRAEMKILFDKIQGTVIYVTHDQSEAMTMSDRVVIMDKGVIQQIGKPLSVYNNPNNLFVAGFLGNPQMNFIEIIVDIKENNINFIFEESSYILPINNNLPKRIKDNIANFKNKMIIGVRPEDIQLCLKNIENYPIKGIIKLIEPIGSSFYVHIETNSKRIVSIVDTDFCGNIGDCVAILFKNYKIHLFDLNNNKNVTIN